MTFSPLIAIPNADADLLIGLPQSIWVVRVTAIQYIPKSGRWTGLVKNTFAFFPFHFFFSNTLGPIHDSVHTSTNFGTEIL